MAPPHSVLWAIHGASAGLCDPPPIFTLLGWEWVFYITGGLGVFIVVPMFLLFLKNVPDETYQVTITEPDTETPASKGKITFSDLGGAPFLLLIFSYFANGMLFFGGGNPLYPNGRNFIKVYGNIAGDSQRTALFPGNTTGDTDFLVQR